MALWLQLANYSKQRGYGRILLAAGELVGGYVNSGEVRYIFRNHEPAPGIRALYGGNVVRRKGRLAPPSAEWSKPDCSGAIIG